MSKWGHWRAAASEPCSSWMEVSSLAACLPAPQDAFHAFHRDLDFVRKFMKPLLIGELAPEEPSQDHGKNVSVPRPRKERRV